MWMRLLSTCEFVQARAKITCEIRGARFCANDFFSFTPELPISSRLLFISTNWGHKMMRLSTYISTSDVKMDRQKRQMYREAKKVKLVRKKLRQQVSEAAFCREWRLTRQVPIVTIPGFKGSVLEREDGTVVWLTAAQVLVLLPLFLISRHLGSTHPILRYLRNGRKGFRRLTTFTPCTPSRPSLVCTLVARWFAVIPYLYEPQIYGEWIRKITDEKCHSYEFSYDWRRSLLESESEYDIFVHRLSVSSGKVSCVPALDQCQAQRKENSSCGS